VRYWHQYTYVFKSRTRYSCQILTKFEFLTDFLQIFEKYLNLEFHENPSSGRCVVPCGRTDRHEKGNSVFFFAILRTRQKILHAYPLDL